VARLPTHVMFIVRYALRTRYLLTSYWDPALSPRAPRAECRGEVYHM